MEEDKLNDLIKERTQEAKDKQILDRGWTLFECYGSKIPNSEIKINFDRTLALNRADEYIDVDIFYRGEEVFSGRGTKYFEGGLSERIKSYIPGKWTQEFDKAYEHYEVLMAKEDAKIDERFKLEQIEKQKDLANNFGIEWEE